MPRVSSLLRVAAIAGFLGVVAGCGSSAKTGSGQNSGTITIHGAGSTFAAPLYHQWAEEYHELHPDIILEYDSVGSGEGQKRFLADSVDFGASDAALTDDQIASAKRGAQLIPVAAGGIVLAYNLPGTPSGLRLPRDVYVDIFRGKITSWNDARLRKANPQVNLPNLHITLVVRIDSSGTTFAFTNHLAAISKEWRDGPGIGRAVQWPATYIGGSGNEGVAGQIVRIPGAIGYSEYGIAERANLSMARLENKEGNFVMPTAGSGLATLLTAELPANLRAFFPDPEGKRSYPIVTYTWLLLHKKYDDQRKAEAIKNLVKWGLTDGQRCNEPLGYVRVPPAVEERALEAIENLGNKTPAATVLDSASAAPSSSNP